MSHMILGQRFIAREKPGWHNIAKRIFSKDEKVTAREAMVEVAGDVEVLSTPMFYELEGKRHESKNVLIVRKPLPDDPRYVELGTVSNNWVAASYAELASALDGLSYPVETAGLLQKGGLAFLCFRAPDWNVKGDEMRSYFAANFSLTPGKGHRVFHSPVRVVCWNTNTVGQNQASINLSIPHTSDAIQRIKLATDLVMQFETMRTKTQEIFDAFAGFHVTEAEARAIFQAAYPEPSLPPKLRLLKQTLSATESEMFKTALTPELLIGIQNEEEKYDRQRESVEALQRCSFERFESFEPTDLRGTAWAAYNAVTEVSDWREGKGADVSLLVGSRAQEKSRAFVKALELVKG